MVDGAAREIVSAISLLSDRIGGLESAMVARFERVESRLDRIETRLSKLETMVAALARKLLAHVELRALGLELDAR